MKHLLSIPHRTAHGLCPVNGIRDLIQWRTGRDWSNVFAYGLAQGGGFAYLRFISADPPRQIYWGTASPRQHKYLAELLAAEYSEIENRSFNYSWKKAQGAIESGKPPVIGPLDMFYLHYYPGIYHQRHIPIHYLLLVGYDGENAYVHDTDQNDIQIVPLAELQPAWEVNVPGLGKRNRLVTLNIPANIASNDILIRKSILDECKLMLNPPVSMLGIPAMEKAGREISNWPKELGKEGAEKSLRQVREYLNSPPDLTGDHLTAGRDIYIAFLEEAGEMTGLDLSQAVNLLRTSLSMIPNLAQAIRQGNLISAASTLSGIAEKEKDVFTLLRAKFELNSQ